MTQPMMAGNMNNMYNPAMGQQAYSYPSAGQPQQTYTQQPANSAPAPKAVSISSNAVNWEIVAIKNNCNFDSTLLIVNYLRCEINANLSNSC